MNEPSSPSSLRERALERLADPGKAQAQRQPKGREWREVVHELQVQQLELELQCHELQAAQRHLEESRTALETTERRYRELFERAPVGYLSLDRDGAILEANQPLANLLEEETARLAGRKLSSLIASYDQDAYHLHRRAALRGETPDPIRVTLCAPGGALRDVELKACSSAGDQGQLSVALLDVTARERAEARRADSERQRRLLSEALPLAFAYVGSDGRCESSNRAFQRLFRRPTEPVDGRTLLEVLGPDVYAALRDAVRAALLGETARFEGSLPIPGAGARFLSAFLAPDRTPDGRVRGFCVLIDDRSELEEARRGLRSAAAQIGLAEQRERRALAADLHDGVGQLLSLLSIKLCALQERATAKDWAAPLQELADLARRAREGVSTLTLELSPSLLYDLGFVAAAEWLLENLRAWYGLKSTLEQRGEMPNLDEATRVTLFRALRELLINVAKHAGTNRARVRIDGRADGVTVVVEDDGRGFDPKGEARGFGLRSVGDRIESLGGRILVDSRPGRGTKISLTMPAGGRPSNP